MYVMLDFETLGNDFTTVVLSLGAVAYNKDGIVAEALFEFDLHEQFRLGRTTTASTMQFWMTKADAEARKVFEHNDFKLKMPEFFRHFEEFIDNALNKVQEKREDLRPISNGGNFDVVILEDLYRRHHPRGEYAILWKFWNVWCYRTFAAMTGCKDLVRRVGTHHNALDDARFQTNTVLAFWKKQEAMKAAKAKVAP